MSEQPVSAPDAPPRPAGRRRGGRVSGLFTEHIGPLPMWGWVAIVGGGMIAWRWYSSRQAASSAAASTGATAADQVPQFVNQTYTTVTPPVAEPAAAPPETEPSPTPEPHPSKPPRPPVRRPQPPQRLRRQWIAPKSGGTLAQVSQRLTGRPMPSLLTPANAIAQKFIEGPYRKNKHAPIPKGAKFTYLEGQVT